MQPRDLAEIDQILREEQGVERKCNRRNSQIHCPDAHFQPNQSLELCSGRLIEVEHGPRGEIAEQPNLMKHVGNSLDIFSVFASKAVMSSDQFLAS